MATMSFSKALLDYCLADVALTTQMKPPTTTDLGRVFDLHWIDPSFYEVEGKPLREFERHRRFPHCGAAIAWARRQIFHGKVFGSHIEMRVVHRMQIVGEKVMECEDDVVDITLPGFCRWQEPDYHGAQGRSYYLGGPERKCRTVAR